MTETAARPVFRRVTSRHARVVVLPGPQRQGYVPPTSSDSLITGVLPAVKLSDILSATASAMPLLSTSSTTLMEARSAQPAVTQSQIARAIANALPVVARSEIARQAAAAKAAAPPTRAEEVARAMASARRFSEEGTGYLTQGKFDDAEKLFVLALNITQSFLGEFHYGVTKPLEILATFYLNRANYLQAEPLLKRLYGIRLKQHREGLKTIDDFQARENYLLMALTVDKCSSCLEKLGLLSISETIYLTLLKRQEEHFGHEHALTLDALERLGEFYLRARVYGLAQVVFEKLYDTKSKLHGPQSMEVSAVLSSLSVIYSNLELFFDQVAVLETQVFLLDTVHGGTGLSMASALVRLADALSNAAKERSDIELSERATLIYRRALTIYERHYGPYTPTVVGLRNKLKSLKEQLS